MALSSLRSNSTPTDDSNPSLLASKSLRVVSQRASTSCSFEGPVGTVAIFFLKVCDFNFQGCGSSPFCKYTWEDHMSNYTHETRTVNRYINSPSIGFDKYFLKCAKQKKDRVHENQTHLVYMDLCCKKNKR